jgi:hypothetical protein
MGLSEKTNFEVTLFRAVEAGRNRSIDQVIRKISGMIPNDLKKKVELNKTPVAPIENIQNSSEEKFTEIESSGTNSSDNLILEEPKSVLPNNINEFENISSPEVEIESKVIKNKSEGKNEEPRQVLDRKKIETKIAELPNGIRGILEEKFQADFVSIEKIDMEKLI